MKLLTLTIIIILLVSLASCSDGDINESATLIEPAQTVTTLEAPTTSPETTHPPTTTALPDYLSECDKARRDWVAEVDSVFYDDPDFAYDNALLPLEMDSITDIEVNDTNVIEIYGESNHKEWVCLILPSEAHGPNRWGWNDD
jgi:hypothetical protein